MVGLEVDAGWGWRDESRGRNEWGKKKKKKNKNKKNKKKKNKKKKNKKNKKNKKKRYNYDSNDNNGTHLSRVQQRRLGARDEAERVDLWKVGKLGGVDLANDKGVGLLAARAAQA